MKKLSKDYLDQQFKGKGKFLQGEKEGIFYPCLNPCADFAKGLIKDFNAKEPEFLKRLSWPIRVATIYGRQQPKNRALNKLSAEIEDFIANQIEEANIYMTLDQLNKDLLIEFYNLWLTATYFYEHNAIDGYNHITETKLKAAEENNDLAEIKSLKKGLRSYKREEEIRQIIYGKILAYLEKLIEEEEAKAANKAPNEPVVAIDLFSLNNNKAELTEGPKQAVLAPETLINELKAAVTSSAAALTPAQHIKIVYSEKEEKAAILDYFQNWLNIEEQYFLDSKGKVDHIYTLLKLREIIDDCQKSWYVLPFSWKPIPIEGYEKYEISSYGTIRGPKLAETDGNDNGTGYKICSLSKDGKQKSFLISRLVALAFIDNPYNLPQVDHIDGNTYNNRADNLQWISRADNLKKAKKRETYTGGNKPNRVICVETGDIFITQNAAAKFANRSDVALMKSLQKGTKCGGYTFKYLDKENVTPKNGHPSKKPVICVETGQIYNSC